MEYLTKLGVSSYSFNGFSGDTIDGLGNSSRVVRLATIDDTRASEGDAGLAELVLVQKVKLGVGNGLLDILLARLAICYALEHLNRLLSTLADRGSGTTELNSKKASIGIG